MSDYKSIQIYIKRAQLERQIYLANLMADGIMFVISKLKSLVIRSKIVVDSIGEASQKTRIRKNVFTFDN